MDSLSMLSNKMTLQLDSCYSPTSGAIGGTDSSSGCSQCMWARTSERVVCLLRCINSWRITWILGDHVGSGFTMRRGCQRCGSQSFRKWRWRSHTTIYSMWIHHQRIRVSLLNDILHLWVIIRIIKLELIWLYIMKWEGRLIIYFVIHFI